MASKKKADLADEDLLAITDLDDFNHKWPTDLRQFPFDDNHWNEVSRLFFNPPSEKQSNIWHNEIREIALFNLFSVDSTTMQHDNHDLYVLYEEWNAAVNQCIDNYTKIHSLPQPVQISNIEKKGGQKTSHDFELEVKDATGTIHHIKIEFKFSASRISSIAGLAQFAAINTESASALTFFGEQGYLDFFFDQGYLRRICELVGFDFKLLKKNEWKKTAKSVCVPKNPDILKRFHTSMRDIIDNVAKEAKKKMVNNSFAAYISDRMTYIREHFVPISAVFNDKQTDKFFCIFSNGTFKVETIANIVIDNVTHEPDDHFFILHTIGGFSIKCDMSWGNGGAGNQNPRVLFKLVEEKSSSKSTSRKRKKSFGGNNIIMAGDLPINEELAIGDTRGKKAIMDIGRTGVMKPSPEFIQRLMLLPKHKTRSKSSSKKRRSVTKL